MFNALTGGLPLGMYQNLQKDYPGGQGLGGLLALAQQQFQEDKRLFEESQRAEGEAGTVQYAYTDPYFEASSLEEEEGEGGPLGQFASILGTMAPRRFRSSQNDQTAGGDPEFQAWLASKYGTYGGLSSHYN